MIISAEPMASGARSPAAPGSMTVMPTVSTRKNVPMNSTRYFFISAISIVEQLAVSIFSCRQNGRPSFQDLQLGEGLISGREFCGRVWRRINPVVMVLNPLHQSCPVPGVITKITHSVFDGAPFKDHNIIGAMLLEGRDHVGLAKHLQFRRKPDGIGSRVHPTTQIINHGSFGQDRQRRFRRNILFYPGQRNLNVAMKRIHGGAVRHDFVSIASHEYILPQIKKIPTYKKKTTT